MQRVNTIVIQGDLNHLYAKSNENTPKATKAKSRLKMMLHRNSISTEEKLGLANMLNRKDTFKQEEEE